MFNESANETFDKTSITVLPHDMLVETYSNLDSEKDFLSVWQVSKSNQRAIEDALFKQINPAFYPVQLKILTILFNTPSLRKAEWQMNLLLEKFFLMISHPQLSFKQKLAGLQRIALFKNIPLNIDKLLNNPHSSLSESLVQENIIEMTPAFNKKNAGQLVNTLISKVDITEEKLNLFKDLSPYINKTQLNNLFPKLFPKFRNLNPKFQNLIPKFLDSFSSNILKPTNVTDACIFFSGVINLLDMHQIKELITELTILQDTDRITYKSTSKLLRALLLLIDKNHLSDLIKLYKDNLKSQVGWNYRSEACLFFTTLTPFLHGSESGDLKNTIFDLLSDNHEVVRAAACEYFIANIPFCEEDELRNYVNKIVSLLYKDTKSEKLAACEFITNVAPILGSEKLLEYSCIVFKNLNPFCNEATNFFRKVIPLLNAEQFQMMLIKNGPTSAEKYNSSFCDFLTTIASFLDDSQIQNIIKILRVLLNNPNNGYRRIQACDFFIAISSKLNNEQIIELVGDVESLFDDQDDHYIIAACKFFTAIVNYLDKEKLKSPLDKIKPFLKSRHAEVRICAYNFINQAAKRLDKQELDDLVKVVCTSIPEVDKHVSQAACEFFRIVSDSTDEESLTKLAHKILPSLRSEDEIVRQFARDFWLSYSLNLENSSELLPRISADNSIQELQLEIILDWIKLIKIELFSNPQENFEFNKQQTEKICESIIANLEKRPPNSKKTILLKNLLDDITQAKTLDELRCKRSDFRSVCNSHQYSFFNNKVFNRIASSTTSSMEFSSYFDEDNNLKKTR